MIVHITLPFVISSRGLWVPDAQMLVFCGGEGAAELRLSLLFCLLAVLCVVTRTQERCVTTRKMALNKTWIHGLFKSYK